MRLSEPPDGVLDTAHPPLGGGGLGPRVRGGGLTEGPRHALAARVKVRPAAVVLSRGAALRVATVDSARGEERSGAGNHPRLPPQLLTHDPVRGGCPVPDPAAEVGTSRGGRRSVWILCEVDFVMNQRAVFVAGPGWQGGQVVEAVSQGGGQVGDGRGVVEPVPDLARRPGLARHPGHVGHGVPADVTPPGARPGPPSLWLNVLPGRGEGQAAVAGTCLQQGEQGEQLGEQGLERRHGWLAP